MLRSQCCLKTSVTEIYHWLSIIFKLKPICSYCCGCQYKFLVILFTFVSFCSSKHYLNKITVSLSMFTVLHIAELQVAALVLSLTTQREIKKINCDSHILSIPIKTELRSDQSVTVCVFHNYSYSSNILQIEN